MNKGVPPKVQLSQTLEYRLEGGGGLVSVRVNI